MPAEGGVWIGVFLFGDRYLERKQPTRNEGSFAALAARIDDAARLPSHRSRDKD
ncbi:MAG TPA: hypothetical protein VEO96_05280 [Thermoplasmata archaeon]|nr:hypothetical protein [Thermoplasmata archaeon]